MKVLAQSLSRKAAMAEHGARLWDKAASSDSAFDALLHRFTVGDDPILDVQLLPFDCIASAAHARMLMQCGHLSREQCAQLLRELAALHHRARVCELPISQAEEDGHTALENALTKSLGDSGKRIHLGRSRNDQVLVATRLWMKAQVFALQNKLSATVDALLSVSRAQLGAFLPGYTHLQLAMPSSISMWLQGFAAGLLEELEASFALLTRIDRNPLGAAAGFGTGLALDRELTTTLLGFKQTQLPATDCINSRGRHEQALLDAGAQIALTLEKMLWDLSLYTTQEFAFVKLPDGFTTGSSIMPQKRNPDVVELARAQCRALRGFADAHRQIVSGLPSSYHRDLQLSKSPLFTGVERLQTLLSIVPRLISGLQFDQARIALANRNELYATQAAYDLVASGMSFRDAYRQIGAAVLSGALPDQVKNTGYVMQSDQHTQILLEHSLASLHANSDAASLAFEQTLNQLWTI
jgi:argininosuccinate lyase